MTDHIPNPGSKKAQKLGCTCPIEDNNYGAGAREDKNGIMLFWYSDDCPIHGHVLTDEKKENK